MTRSWTSPDGRARLSVDDGGDVCTLIAHGDWLVSTIGVFDRPLSEIAARFSVDKICIDVRELGRIDTAGAYILSRFALKPCGQNGPELSLIGAHDVAQRLMAEVRTRMLNCPPDDTPSRGGIVATFARIGRGFESATREGVDTLAFLGRAILTFLRVVVNPTRLRWNAIVHQMEVVGVDALPIVSILSFFIGAVVAYMGAKLLTTFGASVFTVELVGLSVLREFGVLITAIMLAGRSDSAFAAALGSMKMQQEIDAMKVIGLDPFEVLVLPRIIACVLMAPLLAFAAMLAGIFGGMMVAWTTLDIAPSFFITRMETAIPWNHFWVGMSKAPVFGLLVAIIGCRQGMKVGGDVESLGACTTAAVVQAIFAVIVVDALFAMVYLELGV
ncbi:MlaE family ABC transporter permease [Woodsholea maritima]|uniref:MlaE family ABC transporter permease n=1 Tax=Woodsholea maritima TaxID=240237 RepID=UPI0003776EE5|nr:ABC transporter permease [Woodsholea maritima]